MVDSSSLSGLLRDGHAAQVEREIREELEAHLELCVEDLLAEGRTPDQARGEARARFGDLDKTLRACRRVQLGGRLAMQKLQWILIVVLACSTLILGLRGQAMREMAQAEAARALEQAQHARAALEESRQRELIPLEPVEAIVVGVGDGLKVRCDHQPALEQSTEVQVDGQALFREIGWVEVAGRTRQEVEQELTQRYAQFYSDVGAVYVLVRSAR